MLEIKGKNIEITRGNYMPLTLSPEIEDEGNDFTFKTGDVVLIKIFEKKNVQNVLLEKRFEVQEESAEFTIEVTAEEMKIGELINKPKDYWYEIELNPDSDKTVTLVGYDKEDGPAILTLYPEGGNLDDNKNK